MSLLAIANKTIPFYFRLIIFASRWGEHSGGGLRLALSIDRARTGESPRGYVYPLRLAYESEQFRCQSVLCREARYAPATIIVPWTTLPGFMLMADGSLCALNINARSMELNAVLAYQPHKKQRRGENPAYGLSGHGLSQPFILLKGQRLTGCPFVTSAG